jgi:hypothetical protein
MKTVRFAFSAVALLLLAGGYAASQLAYFRGEWSEYAHKVDQPAVVFVALAVFLIALGLAFVPSDEEVRDQA